MNQFNLASDDRVVRLHGLDFLRGLCALGVAAYHFSLWSKTPKLGVLADILAVFGTYGVSVFFILSGYSLAHAYDNDFQRNVSSVHLLKYFQRRLGRLGPLFVAVVLVSIAGKLLIMGKPLDFIVIFANLTLIFGLVNPAATPVVGGWSIGIEIVFYILFPMLLLIRRAALLIITLSVFTTFWLARDLQTMLSLEAGWTLYVHPANHLIFFVIGVFMRLFSHHLTGVRPVMLALALLVIGAVVVLASSGASELQLVTGWRRVVFVMLSVGLVGLVSKFEVNVRYLWVCAMFAGLSYPLYLIHPIVYFGAKNYIESQPVFVFVFLVFAAVLALLLDRFVDRPAQRHLKKFGW